MKDSTTSAAVVPVAIVEEAWQEVGASFERFCLTAGIATLAHMMEEDAARLCGPRYGRAEARQGTAGGRPRARSAFMAARSKSHGRVCAPVTVARSPWRAGRRRCPRTFWASGR